MPSLRVLGADTKVAVDPTVLEDLVQAIRDSRTLAAACRLFYLNMMDLHLSRDYPEERIRLCPGCLRSMPAM
eukprot:10752557-Lingulodinium_polyedra.AAC.1